MNEQETQILADACTDVVMKHLFPLRYDLCEDLEEDAEMNAAYETLNEKFYNLISEL